MTEQKRLVLDANILIRAVLGTRVRGILETYEDSVLFYAPDVCFTDAYKYVSFISERRRIDPRPGLLLLDSLSRLIEMLDSSLYEEHDGAARERIAFRDEEDWLIVAAALLLNCPVWTEDQDFFGSGVST